MEMIMRGFIKKYFVKIVSILLALLFVYAAASKLFDFENFQVQLAQSPLLSAYAGIISYGILIIEFGVALLLLISQYNRLGLYLSVGLMSAFTIYIFLILNFSDFIPCSCGGILEKLGWKEHLIFNLCFLSLAVLAVCLKTITMGKNGFKALGFSGIIAVCSCAVVLVLFQMSEYIIKKENNFTRRFLLHPVMEDNKMDLGVNSYYFAGSDSKNIYLGNKKAPLLITVLDTNLTKRTVIRAILDNKVHSFRNIKLAVKAPYFFMFDGSVPVIYRGRLGDSIAETISYGDGYFNQLVVLDSLKFALRTQKREDKQFVLASLDLNRAKKLQLQPAVLEKQIDGVFDIDGLLNTGGNSGNFAYTYVYRNQFIVLDSSFHVLNRLHTIDTTSRANISVTRLSDGSYKMNAPPFSVNKNSAMMDEFLLNQSNLKGKHEPSSSWKTSSIIDIYRTDQQKYVGSFYVRKKNGIEMSSMLVANNYLYVLIGDQLIRYKIRKETFK
ncbi:MauE/DoxX family redox-associated membrane protein [Chryseobacterium sp.]|uniref:DoxX family protein n=1 Tax=Chryseobacterium sp. TaxID=1871047 RepID=UPI00333EA9AB